MYSAKNVIRQGTVKGSWTSILRAPVLARIKGVVLYHTGGVGERRLKLWTAPTGCTVLSVKLSGPAPDWVIKLALGT